MTSTLPMRGWSSSIRNDYWPGTGNAPNYGIGPVAVVWPDELQLDTNDADNIGCEGSYGSL